MGGKGKSKNKGGQASKAQQQQQAAARRNLTPSGGTQARPVPGPREAATNTATKRPVAPPVPSTATAQPVTNHYVDISAVRIQQWLGRTPDLKFRRGASVLLSKATSEESWESKLPAGTKWNDEAGSVDGVVSLKYDPASTDAEPTKVLADAARTVAEDMRKAMPHCPIQAVVGEGATYTAAYPGMAKARRDGNFLIDSAPVPAEVILAKPCDQCRAAAATEPNVIVIANDREQALCKECDARFEAAGRTSGRLAQAPQPERELKKALGKAGMRVDDFSDTFAEMARAGRREKDDASTQLALIFADGNKVGNFLSVVANTQGGPDKATIVPLIERATLGALAQAVIDRFSGWAKPQVLVNLAGGDDLLVSVHADDAWLFTKALLTEFSAILNKKATEDKWPRQVRDQIPTLSAGVVFHHLKRPFSDVVRHADEQLEQAKKQAPGIAAIAFLDLTADGDEAPKGRKPITLDELNKHAARLGKVVELPQSRRQALIDLDRNDREGFIRRLADFEANQPLWEIALDAKAVREGRTIDPTPQAVRGELSANESARHAVRRALDIARHWHPAPRQEPREETK